MELKEQESVSAVSVLAENIVGSEIIKLSAEISEKVRGGSRIYNFTIGDFDPKIYPIPDTLKKEIIQAYIDDETNYPAAEGMDLLRKSVLELLRKRDGIHFGEKEILIASGARPIIYTIFRVLVDPGEVVLFPCPSWNNNHYSYLNQARIQRIETKAANNFMPVASDIRQHIKEATLIALCSPQNPTGTAFSKSGLVEICDLILEENRRRGDGVKPLYLMYDQIYRELVYDGTQHYDPVVLRSEMKPYTVYVDGISKSLAATGVRVGWCLGPEFIISKIKSLLNHVGAWAPKPEQIATARYLGDVDDYSDFLDNRKAALRKVLRALYDGFESLGKGGLPVGVIPPQGGIYLCVNIPVLGWKRQGGDIISSTAGILEFLLDEAGIAMVPFYAFGTLEHPTWFRLSVGTCKFEEIEQVLQQFRKAVETLVPPK